MKEKRVRIFLLRRWYMVGGAALAMAAVIFYVVNYPASVSTAASSRQLPIYSVERNQKVCAISFDAAWGEEKVRNPEAPFRRTEYMKRGALREMPFMHLWHYIMLRFSRSTHRYTDRTGTRSSDNG